MIKVLAFLLMATLIFAGNPQKSQTYDLKSDYFNVDHKGNIYYLYQRNNLKKLRVFDDKSYVYGTKQFGNLEYIDVTNPLRAILFFKDYLKVVVLDNTLSETGVYDLQSLDIIRPGAVAISFDNNIWVYDELEFKLKKIDSRMNVMNESVNLQNVIGNDIAIDYMVERNGWLYANDPELGVLVFDIYGSYKKTIPLNISKGFQVAQDNIIYQEDSVLTSFNMRSLDKESLEIPSAEDMKAVRVINQKLYILRNVSLDVYNIDDIPTKQ